jgi:hypothetical protein
MAKRSEKVIKEKNEFYQKNLDKRGNVPNSLTVR